MTYHEYSLQELEELAKHEQNGLTKVKIHEAIWAKKFEVYLTVLMRQVKQALQNEKRMIFHEDIHYQLVDVNIYKSFNTFENVIFYIRTQFLYSDAKNTVQCTLLFSQERFEHLFYPQFDQLAYLVYRAHSFSGFIAKKLALYQETQNMQDLDLAIMLECPITALDGLRICELPRKYAHKEDALRIAHQCCIKNIDALSTLLKII